MIKLDIDKAWNIWNEKYSDDVFLNDFWNIVDDIHNATAEEQNAMLEQILTDPENQPSQYGTVPIQWYENLEEKINRIRFNIGEVVDRLDGSYENHAIRKMLQDALE
jgi:hypothetical protein